MRYALKEWNTAIEALGNGSAIAVWRKGGLEDTPSVTVPFESFESSHEQFILFPTFTHQTTDKIKKEFWDLLANKNISNKDNQLKIKYWAELYEEFEINNLEELICVSNQLVNSNDHLVSSWNLYPDHKGKILLLRVYALTDPVLITNSPEYGGCKSWAELKIDIPKIGSNPVLSFKEFNKKARFIKKLLLDTKVTEKITS